ncbi:MAG: hypothetical protein Kow00121_55680 [Elainellaceae cyanobacterium]
MSYLIAVLSNRIQTEDAYRTLLKDGIQTDHVTILGNGYQSADEFGFIEPNQQAAKQSRRLSYWVIPFGYLAGYAFNWLTGITIIEQIGAVGNHILGGVFGAGAAALGALLVGGAVGWTTGSGDALAYRNRLNAGKYLIVVKGPEEIIQQATRILRQFEPENLQGYTEPTTASVK